MKLLTTGSKAMQYWLGEGFWRKPTDTDYVGFSLESPVPLTEATEQLPNFLYSDIKNRVEFFSVDLCDPLRRIVLRNEDSNYMDLKNILIMKNAHKHFYMGKFRKSFKHLMDYSNLLQVVQLDEEEKQLSLEYRDWLIEFAYNNDQRLLHFPKLNKTKEQFFNDRVTYYVDHDMIHEKVAIEDKPAYTKCLTGEVMFSNKLFSELDYQSKVHMVLEESFVLALERCLIPMFHGETYLPAVTPNEAFQYAFVRVATNITSGSFRDFAADNFADIWNQYEKNHKSYFKIIDELLK